LKSGTLFLVGAALIGVFVQFHSSAPNPAPKLSKNAASSITSVQLINTTAVASGQTSPSPTSIRTISPPEPLTKSSASKAAKSRAEIALSSAAIAALIVAASRDAYHSTGHPCACPDDRMRNGRTCGGRSAYSRPGGAAPLCYPQDVTLAMIEAYKHRSASQ
jgi:hypothetical protein